MKFLNQITECIVLSNCFLWPPANYWYLMDSLGTKLLREKNHHSKESFWYKFSAEVWFWWSVKKWWHFLMMLIIKHSQRISGMIWLGATHGLEDHSLEKAGTCQSWWGIWKYVALHMRTFDSSHHMFLWHSNKPKTGDLKHSSPVCQPRQWKTSRHLHLKKREQQRKSQQAI